MRRNLPKRMLKDFEFEVLIADGIKDSSGDLIWWDRPTKITFPEEVNVVLNNQYEKVVGKAKVLRRGDKLCAKFTEILIPHIEAVLPVLTPSFTGKILFREHNILKYIEATEISLDTNNNQDKRIKTLGEQFDVWFNKVEDHHVEKNSKLVHHDTCDGERLVETKH